MSEIKPAEAWWRVKNAIESRSGGVRYLGEPEARAVRVLSDFFLATEGFTWGDVDLLRWAASRHETLEDDFGDLAARIEALLPPR